MKITLQIIMSLSSRLKEETKESTFTDQLTQPLARIVLQKLRMTIESKLYYILTGSYTETISRCFGLLLKNETNI